MHTHLFGQCLVGGVRFCNDQKAAGILINAMHNAGADGPADAGQPPRTVPQQCIDHGAVRVAGRRVHHHAFGLVDHQQAVILIHNVQRNVLGLGFDGLRVRQGEQNRLPGFQLILFVQGAAVAGHTARFDQVLQLAAGKIRALFRQPAIQPQANAFRRKGQFTLFHLWAHSPFAVLLFVRGAYPAAG